jgi:hypothetical protein
MSKMKALKKGKTKNKVKALSERRYTQIQGRIR